MTVGVVDGVTGSRCSPDYYSGWFLEVNGPWGGIDIGFDDNGPTGTNKVGAGFGFGLGAAVCWYTLVEDKFIGECDCD